VAWLFRVPTSRQVARIEADVPCPACGYCHGFLRTVHKLGGALNGKPQVAVLVQHTCGACAARWYEKPVVEVTPGLVGPGIPRTEIEKYEDNLERMGQQAVN